MRGSALPEHRVAAAVTRAGLTGITVKQIATATRLPPEEVERGLARLQAARSVARHGRGLWALTRFAPERSPPGAFRGAEWYEAEFAREFRIATEHVPTEIQFSPNEQLPVHRWWPYVQGFSAGFVAEVCRRYGVGRDSVVLDPFCGSGTVPTAARALGARGIGFDLMPIAAFVADAKGTTWDVDPAEFGRATDTVLADRGRPSIPKPFLRETDRQFDPGALAALLRLKETLDVRPEEPISTLLRLVFAGILIDSSRLKRAPCLGYARKAPATAATPRRLFRARPELVREDLGRLQSERQEWGPPTEIHRGSLDDRPLPPESVDLAVTSPPYVNGMDYVMNYKIDLAWLGFVRSYAELAELRAAMVACDNIPRSVASGHRPSEEVRADPWIGAVTRAIARNVRAKGSYRRGDMAQVVAKYFDDLRPVIASVHRALRPGARFVVVNGDSLIAGTYVPGDLIFARLGVRAGFEVEGFRVVRTRRSGQRRGFRLRESVLTLRKPAAAH